MKVLTVCISFLFSFASLSNNAASCGMRISSVGLQIPVTFKLKLGDIGNRDSIKIDSIVNATHLHAYRVDQFGNEVECEIIKGSVTVAGVARIGAIERGGKLSNPAIFGIRNSANRYVLIYSEFLYKTDTIIKTIDFHVIP